MNDLQSPLLEVKNLTVAFANESGDKQNQWQQILHGVSFSVYKGRTLGLVGESGCGKSITALSIMGLLPQPYSKITSGSIVYQNQELTQLPSQQRYQLRGDRISIIFQDPMTALNPVQTIGQQICEVLALHRPELAKKQRWHHAIELLEKVQIPNPQLRIREYPHHLSGGMRQRVMIAMALACQPDILICDEPTTALDVTVQASILDLMHDLQQETQMAMIFITHDLGVVAEICDDVAVMYGGKVVEYSDVFELFDHPKHPYTKRLLGLMPKLTDKPKQLIDIKPIDTTLFPEFQG